MTEQANSEVNPATEDPTSTPSYEDLLAQNKGLQRANQRYRDDIGIGIKNDAISKKSNSHDSLTTSSWNY